MCGAPKQGGALAGIDLETQTVIQGQVWHDGAPVAGAYVRLLDATDEFTAEVVTSPEGEFRFFAAPGEWKVRSLAPVGKGERRPLRRGRPERDDDRHRIAGTTAAPAPAPPGGRCRCPVAVTGATSARPRCDDAEKCTVAPDAPQKPISVGEVGDHAVEVAVGVLDRADEVAEQLEADRPEQRAPGQQRADPHGLVDRRVVPAEDGDGVVADQAGSRSPAVVRQRPARAASPRIRPEDDAHPRRRRHRVLRAPRSRAPASRRAARTRADAPGPTCGRRGRPRASARRGRRRRSSAASAAAPRSS